MKKFKKIDKNVSERVLGGEMKVTCHTIANDGKIYNGGSWTGKSNTHWNNIHNQCRLNSGARFGNDWVRYEGHVSNDGKGAAGTYRGNR